MNCSSLIDVFYSKSLQDVISKKWYCYINDSMEKSNKQPDYEPGNLSYSKKSSHFELLFILEAVKQIRKDQILNETQ